MKPLTNQAERRTINPMTSPIEDRSDLPAFIEVKLSVMDGDELVIGNMRWMHELPELLRAAADMFDGIVTDHIIEQVEQ